MTKKPKKETTGINNDPYAMMVSKEELNNLQTEFGKSLKEKEDLKIAKNTLEKNLQELHEQKQSLEQKLANAETEKNKLNEKLHESSEKNIRLRFDLEIVEKKLKNSIEESKKYQEEIKQMENVDFQKNQEIKSSNPILKNLDFIRTEKESNNDGFDLSSTLIALSQVTTYLEKLKAPIKNALLKNQELEYVVKKEKDNIRRLENEKNKFKENLAFCQREFSKKQAEFLDKEKDLFVLAQEKVDLEEKLNGGNQVIDNLNDQLDKCREKIAEDKKKFGIEFTTELSSILSKTSSLAKIDPVPLKNLTARSIHEEFASWIEKNLGEYPKKFPEKGELQNKNDKTPEIFLDFDRDKSDIFRKFDWTPDHPFDGLTDGNRKRVFRILNWGWRVKDIILVKAKLYPMPIEKPVDTKKEEENGA